MEGEAEKDAEAVRAANDQIMSADANETPDNKLKAKELQASFVHLSQISRDYNRAYGEFFLASDANDERLKVVAPATLGSYYHRFGWLLFLALRNHAYNHFKDLVTCTNGLVSILATLIIHVPVRLRKFSFQDSAHFVKKGNKVDLLTSLCKIYETSKDELKKMLERTNNLIEDKLEKKSCLASECRNENLDNLDTDGLIYFENLMEESSLSTSISILEKDYDSAIVYKGEVDERLFIYQQESLPRSGSSCERAMDMTEVEKTADSTASPEKAITSPLSPFRYPTTSHLNSTPGGRLKMAATPVSSAMTAAKWLCTIIAPLPSQPSAELERFLSSCDRNITSAVIRRAQIILEAIFPSNGTGEPSAAGSPHSASLMGNEWMEQRRLEAVKLYYRVLQAICSAESHILHGNNLTSLLTNERFHRCMLACSAELVLATHKTVTMLFPAVLERTGITAFDLSKVIESFVRHEETLPRELRRHLNSLEERLLESMVWEKGSSLFNDLIVARPALSAEITRLGLLAEPMPSLDEIAMRINTSYGSLHLAQKRESSPGPNGDLRSPKRACTEYRSVLVERNSFTSPVKDRLLAMNSQKTKLPQPALQSAFASPTKPSPGRGGGTCAETTINLFFGKIGKLAAVRINGMVERLQLSQQMRQNIYCFFQKILSQRTALFFSRHIDQIMLCCFYGIAKVSQLNLTFMKIIHNYRKQPQCNPQVYRSVFVDWTLAHGSGKMGPAQMDVIAFYNKIFIPSVKPLLVEFTPAGAGQRTNLAAEDAYDKNGSPVSPKMSPFPSLPDMSPKKVSSAHNVYVSPLRSSKMGALISHSSRSYYACVGESTHAYQSPSKDLTAINNHLNGKVRGARLLNFDNVEVGLVSDSVVADSLCMQNGGYASPWLLMKSEQPDL